MLFIPRGQTPAVVFPSVTHRLNIPSPVLTWNASISDPFAVTKAEAYRIVGYPKLVQRWLYWSRRFKPWIIVVRQGGRGSATLIDLSSLKNAYLRYLAGDRPPLMPCELKEKKNND